MKNIKESRGISTAAAVIAIIVVAAVVGGSVYFVTRAPEKKAKKGPEAPSAVVFGHSSSFAGGLAGAEAICKGFYDLWTDQVNENGGLYLSKYDEKVPVTWTFYNDSGKTGQNITNTKKLITEDKVDAVYGSYGTFQAKAAQPAVNQYADKYGTWYWAGNATAVFWDKSKEFSSYYTEDKILRNEAGDPWYEWNRTIFTEMPRYYHIEALVDTLRDVGVKDVVIWELGTLYAIESSRHFMNFIEETDIEVLAKEEYSMGITDFTPLINQAKNLDPDAVIQFSYPRDGMLSIEQMIAQDYNPKLFYDSLGVTSDAAYDKFGEQLDGIMYHGTPFPKSPKSVAFGGMSGTEFLDRYHEVTGKAADVIDGVLAYSTCQAMAEVVERAGCTKAENITDAILSTSKDNPIQTLMGPVYWNRGPWPNAKGVLGQHIGTTDDSYGKDAEIINAAFGNTDLTPDFPKNEIDVSEWVTADPLYPKPEWK